MDRNRNLRMARREVRRFFGVGRRIAGEAVFIFAINEAIRHRQGRLSCCNRHYDDRLALAHRMVCLGADLSPALAAPSTTDKPSTKDMASRTASSPRSQPRWSSPNFFLG